jgi:N-acetylneuraminate synthase/N,N'-diacetyllegionaminate synthase
MLTIKNELGTDVGYSDHTLGIEVPIAAVALGAKVIEKHFTLDKKMEGPDHLASLEPAELLAMVQAIRNIESALSGTGEKKPSSSEFKNISVARKSIHLITDLNVGDIVKKEHLQMLRPGDGISPMNMAQIIEKKVNKNLLAGHKISFNDLEG